MSLELSLQNQRAAIATGIAGTVLRRKVDMLNVNADAFVLCRGDPELELSVRVRGRRCAAVAPNTQPSTFERSPARVDHDACDPFSGDPELNFSLGVRFLA